MKTDTTKENFNLKVLNIPKNSQGRYKLTSITQKKGKNTAHRTGHFSTLAPQTRGGGKTGRGQKKNELNER